MLTIKAVNASINTSSVINARLAIANTTGGEPYRGEYDVIPIFRDIELATSGKFMARDVHVESIPVRTTSNLSGGYTVTIGGEM